MATEPMPAGPDLPPEIPSTADERTMAMLCHLGGIISSFIVPLIIWLVKKDESRFVDDQGKEALNFQLTLFIIHLVGGVTICFTWGMVNVAVYVIGIVFAVMAVSASNQGQVYRYPLNIRLIK